MVRVFCLWVLSAGRPVQNHKNWNLPTAGKALTVANLTAERSSWRWVPVLGKAAGLFALRYRRFETGQQAAGDPARPAA